MSQLGLESLSPMERDDLLVKIQSLKDLPTNERNVATNRIAKMFVAARRRDVGRALELLRQITNVKFPYYAYAKILEMRILKHGGDDRGALAIEAELNRNFAHAFEWIDYRARHGLQRTIYPSSDH